MDNANLTAAKAASIMDNANLTAAKAASICDSANITSAKIKAILDTGSLTVADKIAALLDGDSLTAADAATHVNSGTYTDALMASAFDSSYLAAAKAASIMDNANLTAAKAASIMDNANLTAAKAASILHDANLSIQKGQDIVNAMLHKGKPTINSRVALVKDDFEDNKVTNRDRAGIYDANYIYLFMRPEWKGETVNTSVSGGVLTITASDSEIYVDCESNQGTNLHAICYCEDRGTKDWHIARFVFIRVDENNYYYVGPGADGANWRKRFGKLVNDTHTELWSATTTSSNTGTWEVKADGAGNYEVILNGGSQTTITDTDITKNYGFGLASTGPVSDGVKFDNLDIKPL